MKNGFIWKELLYYMGNESIIWHKEVDIFIDCLKVKICCQVTVILKKVLTEEIVDDFKAYVIGVNVFLVFRVDAYPHLVS